MIGHWAGWFVIENATDAEISDHWYDVSGYPGTTPDGSDNTLWSDNGPISTCPQGH